MASLNQIFQITTCTLQITDAKGNVQDLEFSKDVIRVGAHGKCDIVVVDETVSLTVNGERERGMFWLIKIQLMEHMYGLKN